MREGMKLVPKLRFPEFREAGEWGSMRLGSTGQLTRGLTYSSDDVAPTGLLVLRSTNIQDGSLVLDQDLVFVGKPCPEALCLQAGDIVICMSNGSKALVGKSGEYFAEYEGGITVGAFCSFFRPKFAFVKIAFHLNSYQKYIADLIAGGNINNLTNSVLEDFRFPVPPLIAEQKKIADCLSSLDELIAALARKMNALKTHKKGLMQQLFPRESETQPRMRFPEFRNTGDWEEARLGQMGALVSGLTYSPDDVRDSGLLVLRSSNVQDGKISLADCVYVDPSIKGSNLSLANDILICVRNGSAALIGKNALIPEGMPLCTHGAFMTVFRSKSPKFVFQLLQTERYQKQVAGDLGATINSINGSQLVKYKFMVPEPKEQEKIADSLSSVDDTITAASQALETLKTYKKGLMQQLFPLAEAVEV